MIEKEETRLDKYEPIVKTMLVYLSCREHIPRLFLSSMVHLSVLCCFLVNKAIVLKLLDVFCKLVFDPEGKSLSILIIRDWPLPRFQSHFR